MLLGLLWSLDQFRQEPWAYTEAACPKVLPGVITES